MYPVLDSRYHTGSYTTCGHSIPYRYTMCVYLSLHIYIYIQYTLYILDYMTISIPDSEHTLDIHWIVYMYATCTAIHILCICSTSTTHYTIHATLYTLLYDTIPY